MKKGMKVLLYICYLQSTTAVIASFVKIPNSFPSYIVSNPSYIYRRWGIGLQQGIQKKSRRYSLMPPSNHGHDATQNERTYNFNLEDDASRSSDISDAIYEKYELSNSRFFRWKFLQNILEEEDEPTCQEINHVLYKTMVQAMLVDIDTCQDKTIPILTDEQRRVLGTLMCLEAYSDESLSEIGDNPGQIGVIRAIPHDVSATDGVACTAFMETMDNLDLLQPDQTEDEDAFRSCWDLVMEMYGKESTRIAEQGGAFSWRARSGVVRLLLHFNFLIQDMDSN